MRAPLRGERVETPIGDGTVLDLQMSAPKWDRIDAVLVAMDDGAETYFPPEDVRLLEET